MKQAAVVQARKRPRERKTVRKVLLFCGILSSLVYIGADILAASRWKEYSYTDQMVSELMAIDAPTRPLLVELFSVHNALAIAFGIGVWLSAGQKRSLRITGGLLVAYGIVGQLALLFAPMHLRGTEALAKGSLTDTMHIVATMVLSVLTVLYMGFGSTARGKAFRLYSIATILILMVFGVLTGMQGSRVGAGLPTPWFGITERVDIYSSMLWMLVLGVVLLQAEREREAIPVLI